MKKVLYMAFETSGGGTVGISLNDPRADVTEEEIKSVMDLVVEEDVFAVRTGSLTKPKYARITESTEQRFEFKGA